VIVTNLFPEHHEDLLKSGLSAETMTELGLYSVRAEDLKDLIGWIPPCDSALVFPYPGEDAFCRVKVFPAYIDADGNHVKYLQRKESGARLYVPPICEPILANPAIPIGYTEGEKKSAKACQEAVHCLAVGGLWNWRDQGHLLPRIAAIAHVDRLETIYPDSGVWRRPDLLQAVYAFGKEIEALGAQVRVAVIPPFDDGQEQKLDDLLARHGREILQKSH
jgi:hypothetical protein